MHKVSFRLSRGQKAALWLVLLLVIWKLAQTTTMANAAFLFLTAGVIPGTHKALSPGSTAWVAGGVFVGFGLLIFRKEWMRLVRWLIAGRRRTPLPSAGQEAFFDEAPAPIAAADVQAAPAPSPMIVRVPGKPGAAAKQWLLFRALCARFARHTAYYSALALRWLKPHLVAAGRAALAAARVMASVTFAVSLALVLFAATWLGRTWRWLEPHLRQFDRWLEGRVHRLLQREAVAHWADILRPGIKQVKAWWRKAKAVRANRTAQTQPHEEDY